MNHYLQRQNHTSNNESGLESLFQMSSLFRDNKPLQIDWNIQEPSELNVGYQISIENETHGESGFFVDFESLCQSFQHQFVKSQTQQQINKLSKKLAKPINLKSRGKAKKLKKQFSKPCCKCKQSQCLKRYCPCFHDDAFCTNCNCQGCRNKNENILEVESARMHVFKNCHRKKQQPREKLLQNSVSYGCSCSKTQCQQGYCECFKRDQVCNENCKCLDCKNVDQISKYLNVNPASFTSFTDLNQVEETQQQQRSTIQNEI